MLGAWQLEMTPHTAVLSLFDLWLMIEYCNVLKKYNIFQNPGHQEVT